MRDLLRHAVTTVRPRGGATAGSAGARPCRRAAVAGWRACRFVTGCVALATLGYAMPGTVLALGLLSPLVAVDEAINWLSQQRSRRAASAW